MADTSKEPDQESEAKPGAPQRESGGWVERLAQKSTGLGRDPEEKGPSEEELSERTRLWRLGGLGLQMGATCLLFWWMGRGLDRYFGWTYGAQISMTFIAVIGNMYLVIKDASKIDK